MVNLLALKDEDIVAYGLTRASLLQKLIRRSMLPEALWVVSLYLADKQEQGLSRRLLQIAVEDVGLSLPNAIELIQAESDPYKKVAILCRAEKNREVDRFLLTVAYRPGRFKNADAQTQKEGKTLHQLIKLSTEWFNNKRVKSKLVDFKNYVDLISKDNPRKTTIDCAFDLYLELTRAGVHGARVMLALIALLVTREVPDRPVPELTNLPEMVEANPVPDFALDKHTPYGKKLGRDFTHWEAVGAVVTPEYLYPELMDSKGEEKYPLKPLIYYLEKDK